MTALRMERDPVRIGWARVASAVRPGAGGAAGALRLVDDAAPELPGPDWVRIRPRLAGICGSDLATVDGRSSRWFEPVVSFPFVPGHEVVADHPDGHRVVLEPVLGCVARGLAPCPACAEGHLGRCDRLAEGHLAPGLQTGFCCDTGGGWSTEMMAHPSQLHEVPGELRDADAVMVEPTACAVHAALRGGVGRTDTVAVIGAGTLGLLTVAALARWSAPHHLVVAAKHPQQESWAARLAGSATTLTVCEPSAAARAVRRATGTRMVGTPGRDHLRLGGGADVTFDCVGSPESLATALDLTRPGGRVVLVGMPAPATVDLTPLWQREIELRGAYAYGTEQVDGTTVRTFDLAAELVAAHRLGDLVTAAYPLARHAEALRHAAEAGRRGAVKVAFAPAAGPHEKATLP